MLQRYLRRLRVDCEVPEPRSDQSASDENRYERIAERLRKTAASQLPPSLLNRLRHCALLPGASAELPLRHGPPNWLINKQYKVRKRACQMTFGTHERSTQNISTSRRCLWIGGPSIWAR